MTTRTFTVEELDEYLLDPVLDIHVDSGRWSEHHEVVFMANDTKLFVVNTEVGLTEMQDYSGYERYPDYEYGADGSTGVVECTEVEIYEEPVIVRKWRPKT